MNNFKRTKNLVEWVIMIVIVSYTIFNCFFLHILFTNSYKSGDLTFYFNSLEKYGITTAEQLNMFYKTCDEIADEASKNPFYTKKKIKILFSDSYSIFTFGSLFSPKAIGTTMTFFNYSRILLSKTDLKKMIVISSAKENNTRDLKSVIIHELTHSYRIKTISIVSKIFRPDWKEEGICEVVASDSTYNIDEGIERLISKQPDNSNSYKYFTYRMCVLYMMKHDGLSFEEVIKDKRKQEEILSELYSLPETELKKLLE